MELLSPAGNIDKLAYAYAYGADAAYIGVGNFSLRQKADNFHGDEYRRIGTVKGDKKLYCALNILFHDSDIARLEENLAYLSNYPFDAFIITDPGIIPMLRRAFPKAALHLSTQASCVNSETARFYRDLGFSRLILGRELSLREIAAIRSSVPDVELEVFVHGAMCLAYSGRCFLSAYTAGRSANLGECSHSCRWEYRYLEERQRPGEYFPVIEGDGFTTILSSKDLCMIDHLGDLKEAGVDSLKIEGRMKSLYYTATVTRAYRMALKALAGGAVPDLDAYKAELSLVSHREFCTGFFYGKEAVEPPTTRSYERERLFLGTVGEEVSPGVYRAEVKNHIDTREPIEFIGPEVLYIRDGGYILCDGDGKPVAQADHGKTYTIRPSVPVGPGYIMRDAERADRD